jgi:hypothetical protein
MSFFCEGFFAKKVRTACLRTNNGIVSLTNSSEYLYDVKSEIKVDVFNNVEKVKKNTTTIGELITAECASIVYVCISCT